MAVGGCLPLIFHFGSAERPLKHHQKQFGSSSSKYSSLLQGPDKREENLQPTFCRRNWMKNDIIFSLLVSQVLYLALHAEKTYGEIFVMFF